MTNRLFVYGSLAPGQRNGHVLVNVPGRWEPATVTGALRQEGWGAAMGYPGIVLDPAGAAVEGFIFSSGHLFAPWARLDAFEGERSEEHTSELQSLMRISYAVFCLKKKKKKK